MLFNGLNPVVDSTSKFPLGEQGPWLEEHPLFWGFMPGIETDAVFSRHSLWCDCGLWVPFLPLQAYSLVNSNQGGGSSCIPTLGQGEGESFAVEFRHSATTPETVLLCQLG